MGQSFRAKIAIVTGAASGIGREIACALADQGATLGVVDINAAALAETVQLIQARGGTARSFVADLSKEEAITRLAQDILQSFGHVDLLMNNAGVAVVAPLLSTKEQDWDWILAINLRAPIRLTRALLPSMIERRSGHIAFTASMAGLVGAPGMSAYSTTKFGLVGFAEALSLEVKDAGIDVTVVCPGYVRTNLHHATRYTNDSMKKLLDAPPSWYGVRQDDAGRRIVRALANKSPLFVFGVEKLGWWVKRLWPRAGLALSRLTARRMGLSISAQ
jgi:NAD(P)-dependent dehydrogenase (short-subunit alcohol dehydrogenase family)